MKGLMGALGGGMPNMGDMPQDMLGGQSGQPKAGADMPDFDQLQKQLGNTDLSKLGGLGKLPSGLGFPLRKNELKCMKRKLNYGS